MVKVFSLAIIHVTSGQGVELSSEQDLTSFSFYQKTSVGEFMKFMSKTVAERTAPGQRQSVQEGNYIAHAYNRGGDAQLISVVITDTDYPVRPAFSLLSKILDEYATAVPEAQWSNPPPFPATKEYLSKYQDPKQADNIMKVQAELDETKIILHKTIESVLERGEKLDNLVDRSNALSAQSKMFYKTAKKASCSHCDWVFFY